MTFVILTGGIDLSVGSILALSSALMGSFIKGGMDPVFGIVLACLIGAALGSVNGLVITYGKVAPFIATLATMTIFRGLTLVYTNGNPISSLSEDDRFLEFGQGYVAGLPVPAIMMLIMLLSTNVQVVRLFIINLLSRKIVKSVVIIGILMV